MMWSEKYRPQRLIDLIGNEDARKSFVEWFKKWRKGTKPLLLVGPPGIGKTTMANLASRDFSFDMISDVMYTLTIELEFFGNTYTDIHENINDTTISISSNSLDPLLVVTSQDDAVFTIFLCLYVLELRLWVCALLVGSECLYSWTELGYKEDGKG